MLSSTGAQVPGEVDGQLTVPDAGAVLSTNCAQEAPKRMPLRSGHGEQGVSRVIPSAYVGGETRMCAIRPGTRLTRKVCASHRLIQVRKHMDKHAGQIGLCERANVTVGVKIAMDVLDAHLRRRVRAREGMGNVGVVGSVESA